MPFVAILGAGPLGGALTYTLASRARFDEVRLIDPVGTVAAGKALDVRQAGPPDGSSTRVTGHADLTAAAGAWVLVLADLLPTDERAPDAGDAVRRAVAVAPGATLVCAGDAHASLLSNLVGSGSVAPDLLLASAPAAVAGGARALVAAACDISAHDVAVSLDPLATAPGGLTIAWTRTAIRGRAAEQVLTREHRARLDARLARSWPPGPFALATTAARTAEAAWFGSRRSQPAWVVDRSLCSPVSAGDIHTGPCLVDIRFAPGGHLQRATLEARP